MYDYLLYRTQIWRARDRQQKVIVEWVIKFIDKFVLISYSKPYCRNEGDFQANEHNNNNQHIAELMWKKLFLLFFIVQHSTYRKKAERYERKQRQNGKSLKMLLFGRIKSFPFPQFFFSFLPSRVICKAKSVLFSTVNPPCILFYSP